MIASRTTATIVHVRFVEGKTGAHYATSPDLTGLVVAGETRADVQASLPGAIRSMFAASGVAANIYPGTATEEDGDTWIAVPEELRSAAESSDRSFTQAG